MPVRELRCDTEACEYHGITFEWFAKSHSRPDPACPKCGVGMTRLLSTFNTPFVGLLDKYKKPGMERCGEHKDGHWVWEKPKVEGDAPKRRLIRTHQEQREYCKSEGLVMPDEIQSNSYISSDGKTLLEGQTWRMAESTAITRTGNPWLEVE